MLLKRCLCILGIFVKNMIEHSDEAKFWFDGAVIGDQEKKKTDHVDVRERGKNGKRRFRTFAPLTMFL